MRIAAVTAGLFLALTTSLTGQKLQTGTWEGTVTPPEGNPVNVQYDVSYDGDALAITMNFEMGTFAFMDITYTDGVLGFTWNPGLDLFCELSEDDEGGFKGECVDSAGEPGVLTMTPPTG